MSSRVAPFGNPRINGYLLLPEAFRSLSRPSSAPDAKAFPLRSFQLDLLVAKSVRLRFRFPAKTPPTPLLLAFAENSFSANGGRELRVCFELSENSWFSLRIMQAYKDSKLYVTLHPFGCCSTINLLRHVSPHDASLLPYLLCHIVQFSRCRAPASLEARSKHSSSLKCFDPVSTLVEISGFEPLTSCLQGRRSPS